QVFPIEKIFAAYQKVNAENIFVTDDVAAAAQIGIRVALVENLSPNPKLTVPEDLIFCEALLAKSLRL
ncbi:MAG: 2-C-methyl-D-erythritol 4-phosphate cytidylyltransferase, partial [Opitutales bacterium]|nr:2-C-methyl-D-erythritol 4-phosphate cytidylyltransferase [Opitutales bacterium]